MKTQVEIINKIKEIEKNGEDFFGVTRSDLVDFLTFENAKTFLKEDVTEKSWNELRAKIGIFVEGSDEVAINRMLDYLPFAWEKANDCRGLSASRSIDHMKAYLWLLGDEELLNYIKNNYMLYGKNILKKISVKYKFEWEKHHNGLSGNSEDYQVPDDLSCY